MGAEGELDEDLHSRQIAVYGKETMRKMASFPQGSFPAPEILPGSPGLLSVKRTHRLQPLSRMPRRPLRHSG
jgi:hypothetical protein